MRRARFILLGASLAVMPVATAAAATPPSPSASPIVTQQENLVDHLRTDPYFFTDQVPRLLTPSVIANVRAITARMPVPTYLMVVYGTSSSNLVPIVHDRLGRDGVYVAVTPDGLGVSAEQYGSAKDLQVSAAAEDLTWVLPYNAGLVRALDRFVTDVRSGHADAIEQADYKRYGGHSANDPADPATASHRYGLAAGAVLGVILAALLFWSRARRRQRPGPVGRTRSIGRGRSVRRAS